MAETKATNGVSGNKKPVRKERVSKLGKYEDKFVIVGTDFETKDYINEKGVASEDASGASSNNTESSASKKEAVATQSSYIQTGNTISYEFDSQKLEQEKLEMKLKGEEREKEEQEQENSGKDQR